LRIGQRLRVPDRGGAYVTYEMPKESQESTGASESDQDSSTKSTQAETDRDTAGDGEAIKVHVVRRGENLSIIARRYGLSVDELLRLNKLSRRAVLRVGQQLRLKDEPESVNSSRSTQSASRKTVKGPRKSSAAKMIAARTPHRKTTVRQAAMAKIEVDKSRRHTVRRGETLSEIAARYRVPMAHIARKNDLRKGAHLLAGTELVIPARR
jgi:LysM repeat protein